MMSNRHDTQSEVSSTCSFIIQAFHNYFAKLLPRGSSSFLAIKYVYAIKP